MAEKKADLLDEVKADESALKEFAETNEFCGAFRTSAKTGLNISESMEYLIKVIIKRMEDIQNKGSEVFSTDRKNVALDPEKHTPVTSKRKSDKGCC